MNISIFGLGYVGCVSAACLSADGHSVLAVDVVQQKIDDLNSGRSPIVEEDVDRLVGESIRHGRLRATMDLHAAIDGTELSFVCVGTPSATRGLPDVSQLRRVASEIGRSLRRIERRHTIVFRSTVLPGTTESLLVPMLEEESGKKAGHDFGVAFHPEFLREGTAVSDFRGPSQIVIGARDQETAELLEHLYRAMDAPKFVTDIRTAELVKYASNAFHAVKVAFANEIGSIARQHHVDGHALMQMFCADTVLNVSSAYLKPGHAFGGSCLPKDLRALVAHAHDADLKVPLLGSVLTSNDEHKKRILRLVTASGKRKIGVLGLSFKEGTDDLRESPTVELLEALIGKGFSVTVYDPCVAVARLIGTNKTYIEREIPHIASLMVPSLETLVSTSEIVVWAHNAPEFEDVRRLITRDQILISLVKSPPDITMENATAQGICW